MTKIVLEQDKFVTDEYYKLYVKQREICSEANIAYGKWIIATLIAIHGGALITISQIGEKSAAIFAGAGIWFVAGLVSTLLMGYATWLNFYLLELSYFKKADPRMTFDKEYWPEETAHLRKINATFYVSILFALIALVCFPAGAFNAHYVLLSLV